MDDGKTHLARNVWQRMNIFNSSMRYQIRDAWLGQYIPPKPFKLHFLANDVCDSHCSMCNIWGREQGEEISLAELAQILADPIFGEIQHLDISGGEPTLRPDLPQIGRVFIEALPKLKSIQIITNALDSQTVIERISAFAQLTRAAGIHLNVSVSLDGVGADHDRNRGIEGNYNSAVEVIRTLEKKEVSVSVNCTLTPLNVHAADDVLLWCEENRIRDWSFRPAIEAKRFYNQDYSQRNPFTSEQRFHISLFFDKLARYKRLDYSKRIFYRDLADQIYYESARISTCAFQTRAVTLDMRGDISYCPPQSPILGSAIEKSAWQIYTGIIHERRRILCEHCASCQYDSLGPPSAREIMGRGKDALTKQFQHRRKVLLPKRAKSIKSILPADRNYPHEWRRVLITGWYGTETAGDKAILGELLHFLKTYAPGCGVTLTTINRKVSRQTQLELPDLHGASQVDIAKAHDPGLIESVDAVIIGGGPLMEITQMESIWRMFVEANRQRKARIVFGCGVGPLYSDHMQEITGDILQMTTAGFLRDEESHAWAAQLAPGNALGYACDPAFAYVRRWSTRLKDHAHDNNSPLRIAGLLRANTNEFISEQSKLELQDSNRNVARQLAQVLETTCRKSRASVDLLHMNAPWLGGDDRLFNRQIANFFGDPGLVHVERNYLSLEALIRSLYSADSAVVMRYHGHIFCMALGIPFLSIDYTGKHGKVQSLMQRVGYMSWSEDWRAIDVTRAVERLQKLLDEREHWSIYLQQQADRLVNQLHQTYAQVFLVQEPHNS